MQLILATLKKKGYLLLTLVLTIIFTALYVFLDLRQGGTHNTMLNTHTVTPQYLGAHFGLLYISSSLGLSVLSAFLTALLIAFTIDHARMRSGLFSTTTCSTSATVILGIATFSCPSCTLPIAGTLGLIFTSQALPFFGIEFHVLSLLILLGTFVWLIRLMHKRQIQVPHVTVLPGSGNPT